MPKAKKEVKSRYNYSKIPYIVLTIIFIMAVFYILDLYAHSLSESYAVPSYYFKNKIIYGLLFLFASYYFAREKSPIIKALSVSTVTAILLQVNYFLEGYPIDFVFLFLVLHWIMIFIPSIIAFNLLKKKI